MILRLVVYFIWVIFGVISKAALMASVVQTCMLRQECLFSVDIGSYTSGQLAKSAIWIVRTSLGSVLETACNSTSLSSPVSPTDIGLYRVDASLTRTATTAAPTLSGTTATYSFGEYWGNIGKHTNFTVCWTQNTTWSSSTGFSIYYQELIVEGPYRLTGAFAAGQIALNVATVQVLTPYTAIPNSGAELLFLKYNKRCNVYSSNTA